MSSLGVLTRRQAGGPVLIRAAWLNYAQMLNLDAEMWDCGRSTAKLRASRILLNSVV